VRGRARGGGDARATAPASVGSGAPVGGGGRELGGFWGLLYFYNYNEMYSSDCHL